MIVKRIKPKMRAGAGRAKALAGYCKGRSIQVQLAAVELEIECVSKYLKELKSTGSAEAKDAHEYLQILLREKEVFENKEMDSRGSALVGYATRMDGRLEHKSAIVGGIPGISTGETFYSGVMSPYSAEREFERFAASTKRGGHPIEHVVFSWPSWEQPSNELAIEAANYALQVAGFPNDCPRIIGVHRDTDNIHAHVVLSRYRPTLDKVWSTNKLIDKMHAGCRASEIQFGFSHDNGNLVVVETGGGKEILEKDFRFSELSAGAREIEQRHGVKSFESFVRESRPFIEYLLQKSSTWEELNKLLAENVGIGLKRHGKGYVATDLSRGDSVVRCKASHAGLGAPIVERRLGSWQEARSMKALRSAAEKSEFSYAVELLKSAESAAPSRSPVADINTERANEKKAALADIQLEYKKKSAEIRAAFHAGVAAIRGQSKSQQEIKRLREKRARDLQAARTAYIEACTAARESKRALRERTATEKGAAERVQRDSDCTVSAFGFRHTAIILVDLNGYRARQNWRGDVTYMLGNAPVLVDDGRRISVHSEMKNHIEDAINLLLQRDPDAATRGIKISGTPTFKYQAIRVLAEQGLELDYSGAVLQQEFELYRQLVLEQHLKDGQEIENERSGFRLV